MIKLLQRLPDGSREEVRDQAIVLVQQLTAQNEEMKKTVVFNEVQYMQRLLLPVIFPTFFFLKGTTRNSIYSFTLKLSVRMQLLNAFHLFLI